MERPTSNLIWKCLALVVASVAATAVLVTPLPLGDPLSWGGDSLEHAVIADSANWLGQPGTSLENGAPFGVDWSALPSGGERLHLATVALLRDVTGDLWTALNLHVFLAIALTALVGFLVLRWMGAAELLAAAGGLVFSLTSPVYDHLEEGHLFLFALYPVPLAVYLACRWTDWDPLVDGGRGWRRLAPSATAVVLIALSSTYYSLFAVLLISLLALLVAIRRLDWRAAVPGLIASASIAVIVGLSSIPRFLVDHGVARLDRRLSDSMRFALNPVGALLPQSESFLGFTSGWGGSPSEAVGTLSLVGLVALAVVLVVGIAGRRRWSDGLLMRLGVLVALCFGIGVAGGLGWFIARAGAHELRAWARISVFIGFLGIAALAVLVTRWLDSGAGGPSGVPDAEHQAAAEVSGFGAGRGILAGTVLVVLLALLEQRSLLPAKESVAALRAEDAEITAMLEAELPVEAQVLVWPSGTMLNDFGPGQVLAPSLLGDGLAYSAGSIRGGSGDWQHTWSAEDTTDQLVAAAAAGFDAVALQASHHLLADSESLSAEVSGELGDPAGTTESGAWQWYDLGPLRATLHERYGADEVVAFGARAIRPLGVAVQGTPGFPSAGRERDALIGAHGAIDVRSHDGDRSGALVAMDICAAEDATVVVSAGDQQQRLHPGEGCDSIVIEVAMDDSAQATVQLEVLGDPMLPGGSDPAVYAELKDIQVFDVGLARSPVLVPAALR